MNTEKAHIRILSLILTITILGILTPVLNTQARYNTDVMVILNGSTMPHPQLTSGAWWDWGVREATEERAAYNGELVKSTLERNKIKISGGGIGNPGGWWHDTWTWLYSNTTPGSWIEFQFTGTYVYVNMAKGGEVNFFIDDEFIETVDTSVITAGNVKAFEAFGLPQGEHTLRLEKVGNTGQIRIQEVGSYSGVNVYGIRMHTLPNKLVYQVGEQTLDPEGGTIELFGGARPKVIPITAGMLSASLDAEGDKTVTVTYNDWITRYPVKVNLPLKEGNINIARDFVTSIEASAGTNPLGSYYSWNVIDGVADGYGTWENPSEVMDTSSEWAGEKSSWIKLDFEMPFEISQVRLYDRAYEAESTKTGRLEFSNGTVQNVTFPTHSHSVTPGVYTKKPILVMFDTPLKDIKWIKYSSDEISANANAVGLAELEVYAPMPELNFKPEISDIVVQSGSQTSIPVRRFESSRNFSGTYELKLPEGWAVVSGAQFSPVIGENDVDTITLSIPENYYRDTDTLEITPTISGGGDDRTWKIATRTSGYTIIDGTKSPFRPAVTVQSPDYFSHITTREPVEILFHAPRFDTSKAYTLYPTGESGQSYGEYRGIDPKDPTNYIKLGEPVDPSVKTPDMSGIPFIALSNDYNKEGSFKFDPTQLPYGPISIHIESSTDDYFDPTGGRSIAYTDHCYMHFFNEVGVRWFPKGASYSEDFPEVLTDIGFSTDSMKLAFLDEFNEDTSEWGYDEWNAWSNETGRNAKYAATIPRHDALSHYPGLPPSPGNHPSGFSYAQASWTWPTYGVDTADRKDIVVPADYNPNTFVDVDTANAGESTGLLKIENKEWPGKVNTSAWLNTQTTGSINSMNRDLEGAFISEPGKASFWEAKVFIPPNPGLWPAFWLLSVPYDYGTGHPGDEIDQIEGYIGLKNERYSISAHKWFYGGSNSAHVYMNQFGAGIDLTDGWHTIGVLMDEDYTYYFYDDQLIPHATHITHDYVWSEGAYFILNNAFRRSDERKWPGGFKRYGDTAQMYVDWVRVYQVETVGFSMAKSSFDITSGQDLRLEVLRGNDVLDRAGTYKVVTPWGEETSIAFAPNSKKDAIELKIPESYRELTGVITITPTGEEPLKVSLTNPSMYSTLIYPDDQGGLVFSFKNLSSRAMTNVDVSVSSTNWKSDGVKTAPSIEPNEEWTVRFENVPMDPQRLETYTFNMVLRDENDFTVSIERPASSLTVPYAASKPTINGVIHGNSGWNGSERFELDITQESVDVHSGFDAGLLGRQGFVKWDDDNFYVAVEVLYNTHIMNRPNLADSWNADSVQISIDAARALGIVRSGPHVQLTAALNPTTNENGLVVEAHSFDTYTRGDRLRNAECVVRRDERTKITTYTMAIPWDSIFTDKFIETYGATVKKDVLTDFMNLGFSVTLNVANPLTGTRHSYVRYMDGIASGKDPLRFGDLILSKKTSNYIPSPVALPEAKPQESSEIPSSTDPLFSDVVDHWARADIEYIVSKKVADGIGDGMFAPDKNISRAEFVALMGKIGIDASEYEEGLSDVTGEDWFAGYVQSGIDSKVIPEEMIVEQQFSPLEPITREEMACIAINMYKYKTGKELERGESVFSDKDSFSPWYEEAVNAAAKAGIVTGKGEGIFEPKANATRAEAVVIVKRLLGVL